jgi:hypothetical protein
METEHDPDVDTGDRGDDADLSLNYKRIAHHWLRGSEKLYPHTTPTGKKTEVPWKSLTPDERKKFEKEKEKEDEAKDDEKLSEQSDEEVDAVAEAAEIAGDLKEMAQKRYDGILKKNPDTKTTLDDVKTFLKERAQRSVRRMLDESKFDIGELEVEDARDMAEDALSEAEEALEKEIVEEETPKEEPSDEDEAEAPEEPVPDETQEEAQEQNDETIQELKEEIQEETEKKEREGEPFYKRPDYSKPIPKMDSAQQSEHAKKSYKDYSENWHPKARANMGKEIANELDHIADIMAPVGKLKKDLESTKEGSPEHAELTAKLEEAESKVVGAANRADQLEAELDGLALSQILDGEPVTGRPQPSKAFSLLAKTLDKTGEATELLGAMGDIGSASTQEKLSNAVGRMNDADLVEFSGGEDGPLGTLVSTLNAKNEYGEPKFGRDHQNYVRDLMREFAVDNMTINHQFVESILKSTDKSTREKLESGGSLVDRLAQGDGLQNIYEQLAEGNIPEEGALEEAQSADRAALLKSIEEADKGTSGKTSSGNVKKFQSFFNTPHNISRESKFLSTPDDDSRGEGHNNFHRRRITMSDKKGGRRLTKKAARNITAELDRLAELFQNEYQTLGVPQDIANDFAHRCDLLSDRVERNAGIERQALTEYDPVDEKKVAPHNFDPEEIGEEDAGPLEQEGDESFMRGEFTQQENRELRERQQDGDIGPDKLVLEEQKPQPGKQAAAKKKRIAAIDSSFGRLSKLATGGLAFIRSMGELEDVLKICQAKLEALASETPGNLATQLAGLLGRNAAPLNKIRDQLTKIIGGGDALDAGASVAIDRIEVSIREVMPHVEDMIDTLRDISTDSSPVAILQSEEYLADASERVKKLLELSAKIVNDSSKVFVKAQKELDKVEKELGLDDKTAAKKSEEEEEVEEEVEEEKTSTKKAFGHGFDLFEE